MKRTDGTDIRAISKIADYERRHKIEQSPANRPLPLHVEDTFDAFVREFGGKKISDLISNKNQMPLNADYIFEKENVIVELKTLEGIFSGVDGFKSVIQVFIDVGRTREEGLTFLMGLADMPCDVKDRILQRMRRSIEKRITKARKQLRISKAFYGSQNTRCLIIVAVDQPPLFGQDIMILMLAKLMGDNYRDRRVDGVIYINPNVPTRPNPDGMEFGGWFPFYRDDHVNTELSAFVNLLGNRWLTFHAQRTGNLNPILELTTPDDMISILRGENIITSEILRPRSQR